MMKIILRFDLRHGTYFRSVLKGTVQIGDGGFVHKRVKRRQNLFPTGVKSAGGFGVSLTEYLIERAEIPLGEVLKEGDDRAEVDDSRIFVELKTAAFAAGGREDSGKAQSLKDLCQVGWRD